MADPGTHVDVAGDFRGQLVIGDHNITVYAEQSVVTIVPPGEQPRPLRRASARLLPRRAAPPVGREQDVAAVRAAVAEHSLVQLHGVPGAGKSTLLRYAAGVLAEDHSDVVFLPARGRDVADLVQEVFEACFEAPGYRPSPAELRRLMADVPLLVLVDDLDWSADERAVLLDGAPEATVVCTATERTVWSDGAALPVSGLTEESARTLLAAVLGRPLRDEEHAIATELWRASDGLPLLLLRAAGASGEGTLPRAAALGELLPRVLSGLSGLARETLTLLNLPGKPVLSPMVLPWLFDDAAALPAALAELTAHGLVLEDGLGYRLAPAEELPPDLAVSSDTVERLAAGLLSWVASPQLPPQLVAEHAELISAVIDATVAAGVARAGARLAKAAAPFAACSLRLGAWERILGRGKIAAERAGDRSILAYLTHEDGIRSLVTGKRMAAAAAIGAAVAVWHELGQASHAALAQQIPALTGPAAHAGVGGQAAAHTAGAQAVAPAAKTAAVGAKTAAGGAKAAAVGAKTAAGGAKAAAVGAKAAAGGAKGTALGVKAGVGLSAKIAIAGAATVVVGGAGYFGVQAFLPAAPTPAASERPAAPQLTGIQLEKALVPQSSFPDDMGIAAGSEVSSGASVSAAQPQHNLATMNCTDWSALLLKTTFVPGFGESAFAANSHATDPDRQQSIYVDQAIYQFPSATAASAFFTGLRRVLSGCGKLDSQSGPPLSDAAIEGHPGFSATLTPLLRTASSYDLYGVTNPRYVLDGDYVYAMAEGVGRNTLVGSLHGLDYLVPQGISRMISNVTGSNPAARTGPAASAPSTTDPTPTGPAAVVRNYIDAINARRYQQAWALGGDKLHETYRQFVAGFARTDHDELTIVATQGDVVTVSLTAVQTDHTRQTYAGTYTVSGGAITAHSIHRTG
ncbi:sensor domain-containing protein [Amycolatopsis sp. cg13]|uniref:sensor domain-containing protein n=1 Tax=Amycolatopsis sp. cg13 TaxID=3238807 RepID=UPI003523DB40